MAVVSNIPKSYHKGLQELISIDDTTFQEIVDGLNLSQLTSSIFKLSETVSKIKSLPEDSVKKIFFCVGGLIYFLEKQNPVEQIVSDVCSIIVRDAIIDDFGEDKKGIFSKRLATLLGIEKLYYASKANGLKGEFGNVFIQSRIISDLRPVFGLDIKETPTAGLLVHSLHIHFNSSVESDHKDMYFALDSEDLSSLKEVISRAQEKESTLKTIFEKSQIQNLD